MSTAAAPKPDLPKPDTGAPKGAIARLIDAWRDRRELAAMAPGELDRMLDDAGLSRTDLPTVLDHARQVGVLLPAALALHGVDAEALTHERLDLMRDMQRVCSGCRSTTACRRFLADGDTAEHARICPNAYSMDRLDGVCG